MTEFLTGHLLANRGVEKFCFTSSPALNSEALRQGSSITLSLHECSFPEGGSEQIASALEENTTLTTLHPTTPDTGIHQAFYDAMAASLLSNSTLQEPQSLQARTLHPTSVCVSSLLLALGMNKTLRKLWMFLDKICGYESVIPALREGLGKNPTLEILTLIHVAYVTQPISQLSRRFS
jgi:hypothetical protein